jgi:uncharacterized membrane protein YraQ (UPF0718 family)|tara:strand:+ start:3224 stop:3457 length:234 start_codon:yes stop_codon:yes gene_type:complete
MNEQIIHYLLIAIATIGLITIPYAIYAIRQLNNWNTNSVIIVLGLAFVLVNCLFVALVGYATIFDAWHLTFNEVING